ncbi:MAG: type IV toxin-antitoxin system AbiEi family antitoxin domain-containing protein [Candidatus Dormibacteria bacterium]
MNDAERSALRLARVQHGVLSRRQALAEGMSGRAIDYRLATGEWVRLFRGAYRLAGTERTFEQQIMAGTLVGGDGAVASHRAAAALMGMPGAPRWVEITVPRTTRVGVEGVIAHRSRLLASDDVSKLKGTPLTTAARTITDLAGVYTKEKLGPMLDHALARRLVTRAQLEARATGRRHDDVLRELLDERPATARPMGSEFEACLFRGLRDAGLPLPVAQYRVLMPEGGEVFLDFAYPDLKLAIEADSFVWHASMAAWQRDRARNGELVALGWSILPITWDLVMRNAAEVARKVGRALRVRNA